MKKTFNITLNNNKEYKEYKEMLLDREFKQIGTRLFEDTNSYIRFTIKK